MNYEAIRPFIQDGDLIAVKSKKGGFPRAIRLFTGSEYTHLACALWLDNGLWAAEMDGAKNVLVPLSQYAATPFDVFNCPVSDRSAVRFSILEGMRDRIAYDWKDILRLGLFFLFKYPLPEREDGSLQCASYVATAYMKCGWHPMPQLPSIPWPAIVVKALGAQPRMQNKPG